MTLLGVHVAKVSKVLEKRKRSNYLDAIKDDAKVLKLGCIQIFVAGPSNTRMAEMDYTEIKSFCASEHINVYVHSSYLSIGIWSVTEGNKESAKAKLAIQHLVNQMTACDDLGALGFVIHLPKNLPHTIIDTLHVIIPTLNKYKTPFMLEMPASRSDDKTYETPEKMDVLNALIMKAFPAFTNWSWVIDTAHLWSCGVEVDEPKIMKKWFSELKYPEKIGLFHLNGSSIEQFETGKDKHKVIFGEEDDIWNPDANVDDGLDARSIKKTSIFQIIKFAKKNNIDLICEINRGSYNDIQFSISALHKIIKAA